jgi:hypothetical protein
MTDKQSAVVVSRELAERIVKTCMFTMLEADYQELRNLLAATPEQAVDVGEPVAWQDPDMPERICTAEHKRYVTERGGPAEAALRPLTEPLYRHSKPPAQPRITMADTLRAYQSAARSPHLVGTSNWCAHMAEQLNSPQD